MTDVRANVAELFASTSEKNSFRLVVVAVIGALLHLLLIENADTRPLLVATNIVMIRNKRENIELIFSSIFASTVPQNDMLWQYCCLEGRMTKCACLNLWVMS